MNDNTDNNDTLDECRDTQLMGFPVWSVIIGFISQVKSFN